MVIFQKQVHSIFAVGTRFVLAVNELQLTELEIFTNWNTDAELQLTVLMLGSRKQSYI